MPHDRLVGKGIVEAAIKLDVIWIILCAILVSTMQAGFCALESGLVRAKNSINVAIKNLVDFCIASVIFWLVGYGVMYGASLGGVIGFQSFQGLGDGALQQAFFLFQLVFCGTATTIVSGAVAERMRFTGYFVSTVVLAGFIYPITGHWAWGGTDNALGWLNAMGFHDFAGATVVHSVGGWMALAAVILIGPRVGRYGGQGIQSSNMPLAVLGVFLLWFGWFGFNGGSEFGFNDRVPRLLVNTAQGGAAGGLAALLFTWLVYRLPRVPLIMNGVIAGLVGITAGCDHFTTAGAIVAGGVAGVLACVTSLLMERLQLDDAVGAVAAHLVPGIWGTLAVALLGSPEGWPATLGRWEMFTVQLTGVVTVGCYAFFVSFGTLWVINRFYSLRVTEEQERVGLNIAEHGASTSTQDLLTRMVEHSRRGDFTQSVEVEPETEAAPIATEYNRVLARVNQVTQELRESERRVSAILANSASPIVIYDCELGGVTYLNERARELLELKSGEALNEADIWVNPGERDIVLQTANSRNRLSDAEVCLRTQGGREFHALISVLKMQLDGAESLCLSFSDISGRKAVEDELRTRASHDPLTGVPNPVHFGDLADHEMRRCRRKRAPVAVMMLDIDHFKSVNDIHGHETGDLVLKEVVSHVTSQLRDIDIVGRLGGEEFAILLPETDARGANLVASRLCRAVAEHPLLLANGISLAVTVSIGIALLQSDAPEDDLKTLLRRADQALYSAKHKGRNRVEMDSYPLEA